MRRSSATRSSRRRSRSSRRTTTSGCRWSTTEGSWASSRAQPSGGDWLKTRLRRRTDLREQRRDGVAELLPDLVVDQVPLLVELLGGAADCDLDLGDAGAHRGEHLAELG